MSMSVKERNENKLINIWKKKENDKRNITKNLKIYPKTS